MNDQEIPVLDCSLDFEIAGFTVRPPTTAFASLFDNFLPEIAFGVFEFFIVLDFKLLN